MSVIIKTDFDKIVAVYIYTVRGYQLSWNKMYRLLKYLYKFKLIRKGEKQFNI